MTGLVEAETAGEGAVGAEAAGAETLGDVIAGDAVAVFVTDGA